VVVVVGLVVVVVFGGAVAPFLVVGAFEVFNFSGWTKKKYISGNITIKI
jgi:hypothetical protein